MYRFEGQSTRTLTPEGNSTFRVSITGIDGAGKDTVTQATLQGLSVDHASVVKLGRPAYEFTDGERRQIFRRTTEAVDAAHGYADRAGNLDFITAANALNVILQSQVLERKVLARENAPSILASSRDLRIDPAVYFSFYAPNKLRAAVDIERRIRTMQRLTCIRRDLIILLRVDPHVAVQRIDARIESEEKEQNHMKQGRGNVVRRKWRHVHENVGDLARLSTGYATAIDALQGIQPTAVVEIDTTELSMAEVVDFAQVAIKRTMDHSIHTGETVSYP